MAKGIYFKDVLKTLVTHNGTKVEYAMPRAKTEINVLTNNGAMSDRFNTHFGFGAYKAKIITFAENSPLKKLGIDQALLTYRKIPLVNKPVKCLSFWQEGNPVKSQFLNSKEDVSCIKNYLKVVQDLIDSKFKLPS